MATEHFTESTANVTLADQLHAEALKIAADFSLCENHIQGFALVAIGADSTTTKVIGSAPLADVLHALACSTSEFR